MDFLLSDDWILCLINLIFMGWSVNEIDKDDEEEQSEDREEDAGRGEVFFCNCSIDVDNVLDDNGEGIM